MASRRVAALALLAALAATVAGCGESAGVAAGATVSVYVSVPLSGPQATAGRRACAGAKGVLAASGGRVAGVRVRAQCLDDSAGAQRWRLAAVGANARTAVEDSTTVAYVGELDPAATRFSRTIVATAGIAQLPGSDGAAAMRRIVTAIREAGGDSELRATVLEAVEARPGA